jgi:GT2 family glycosyltransferase
MIIMTVLTEAVFPEDKPRSGIDIIIATYNRPQFINQLLVQLTSTCQPKDTITVVWQGTQKPSINSDKIKLIYSSPPNLPLARNIGFKEGRNPIALFLDDDVVIDFDLLEKHHNCYEDTTIGAVAGYVDDPVFNRMHSSPSRFIPSTGEIVQNFSFDKNCNCISFMGANMSFRRITLQTIGGFDNNFRHNSLYEDVDCAFRILHTDYKIRYCSDAKVKHLRAGTGGCRTDISYSFLFHSFSNVTYFSLKFLPKSSFKTWIIFWKNRLEYLSRTKRVICIKHNPISVLCGFSGVAAGFFRFLIKGKHLGLPSAIKNIKDQSLL